ncbi:Histidine kinase CKI1 [Platanthera zijinensis]|uniref:Histidine kinase CKI1 n=1 Tax=Platanthera zijinensis TaxID=2320716 RepID=A0AAP0BPD8_9ASPA
MHGLQIVVGRLTYGGGLCLVAVCCSVGWRPAWSCVRSAEVWQLGCVVYKAAIINLFRHIPAHLEAAETGENERVYVEFAFEEAHNGMAAVEYLEKGNTCDLIFMDKDMPVMDGYEATRLIRSLGVKTPIIVLSSIYLQCDKDLFRYFGADDYYQKVVIAWFISLFLTFFEVLVQFILKKLLSLTIFGTSAAYFNNDARVHSCNMDRLK